MTYPIVPPLYITNTWEEKDPPLPELFGPATDTKTASVPGEIFPPIRENSSNLEILTHRIRQETPLNYTKIIRTLFERDRFPDFRSLKKELYKKKVALIGPTRQAAFDLSIARHTSPDFSIYYLNSCTDAFFNSTRLSCQPKEYLVRVVANITPPLNHQKGTSLVHYFKMLNSNFWPQFSSAMLESANDVEILNFVQTLRHSEREDIRTFIGHLHENNRRYKTHGKGSKDSLNRRSESEPSLTTL